MGFFIYDFKLISLFYFGYFILYLVFLLFLLFNYVIFDIFKYVFLYNFFEFKRFWINYIVKLNNLFVNFFCVFLLKFLLL